MLGGSGVPVNSENMSLPTLCEYLTKKEQQVYDGFLSVLMDFVLDLSGLHISYIWFVLATESLSWRLEVEQDIPGLRFLRTDTDTTHSLTGLYDS